MPRWLYGTAIVVYLAGTFGLGLGRLFYWNDLDVGAAMAYGASWPLVTLELLGIL